MITYDTSNFKVKIINNYKSDDLIFIITQYDSLNQLK